MIDIEDLHTQALHQNSETYKDPATGFTVFTELAHLKRGRCCGSICRHCPYGWENVKQKGENLDGKSKVASGDKEGIKQLLSSYSSRASNTSHKMEEKGFNEENCLTKGKGGRHGGKHTKKNVPYTREGDNGTSALMTGERRSKDDDAFEAMGTVDELCSIVGVVHAELSSIVPEAELNGEIDNNTMYGNLPDMLLDVMSRLFDVGSHIANPQKHDESDDSDDSDDDDDDDNSDDPISRRKKVFKVDGVGGGFNSKHVEILEEWVDILTEPMPNLNSFILPTGGKISAQLHVSRCVCRRAERRVIPLVQDGIVDPNASHYLNRLSDFFFTAARWANFCEGLEEIQYRRFVKGADQRDRFTVKLKGSTDIKNDGI